jgi:hypothetical protein
MRAFWIPVYAPFVKDNVQLVTKTKYGPMPKLGLPVQVQCDGFKCMAYLDKDGRWKDLFSHELLPHVLGVVTP